MRGPEAPEKRLVEQVVRLIFGLGHFLQDHAALDFHVGGGERGSGREVEEKVHRLGRPFGGDTRMERDGLLRRVRVALATEPVRDPRDGRARAAARPLEKEMLQEMRRAALLGLLARRAAGHRDREREAPHVAHRFQPHRRPVREPPLEHGRF